MTSEDHSAVGESGRKHSGVQSHQSCTVARCRAGFGAYDRPSAVRYEPTGVNKIGVGGKLDGPSQSRSASG